MKMTKKAITLGLGLVVMGSASFAQSLNDAKKGNRCRTVPESDYHA
jgi:hypothetical protein